MVLFVLAFLGGVLTILSPCILPILPFTFARADQPFRKSGLPLLLSMGLTFAVIASLAVAGGSWLVRRKPIWTNRGPGYFLRTRSVTALGRLRGAAFAPSGAVGQPPYKH